MARLSLCVCVGGGAVRGHLREAPGLVLCCFVLVYLPLWGAEQ